MSQVQTLQDIYLQIADIYDKLCDLPPYVSTSIEQLLEALSDGNWTAPAITLENPDDDELITDAEDSINSLIADCYSFCRDLEVDYQNKLNPSSPLPALPENTSISKLALLINLIAQTKFPVSALLGIVSSILKEILLEQINRTATKKIDNDYFSGGANGSQLILVPSDAIGVIFTFQNVPNWMGKRFAADPLNNEIITPKQDDANCDKYTLFGLGAVSQGIAVRDSPVNKNLYWQTETKLEYQNQYLALQMHTETSVQRYLYLHLEESVTTYFSFLRRV